MYSKKYKRPLVSIGVFFLVFSIFFIAYGSAKLTYPDRLTSTDDPYFHARYEALIAAGQKPPMPVVSTMNWWGGGSLYYGYHHTLAKLIAMFGGATSDENLLRTIKVVHAFLTALFFALFATTTLSLLTAFFPHYTLRTLISLSLLATFLLPTIFPSLSFRLALERPFLVSIIIMWGIVYALIQRRKYLLFFLGFIYPLVYSFTIIALIPVVTYVFIGIYARTSAIWKEYVAPALILLAGLGVGIIMHPNPIHYVFNAYLIHIVLLYNSVFSALPVGVEIKPQLPTTLDYPWIFFMSALIVFGMRYVMHAHRSSSTALPFLLVLSFAYLPLQILFNRTVEYSGPVVMITMLFLLMTAFSEHRAFWTRLWERICFTRLQVATLLLLIYLYVGVVLGTITYQLHYISRDAGVTRFEELHSAIRDVAVAGDRVVVAPFHVFPTAYFFNPTLSYNQGIDPTFTLVASSSLYWMLHHTVMTPSLICGTATCDRHEIDIYSVIHDMYGARFLVMLYVTSGTVPEKQTPNGLLYSFRQSIATIITYFLPDKEVNPVSPPYASLMEFALADPRFQTLYMAMEGDKIYAAFELLDTQTQ